MSDNTESPVRSTPADAAIPPEGTHSSLSTESHDPAVPEAYAAFMRQGWGDRDLDLDLPAHPVAPWAADRKSTV